MLLAATDTWKLHHKRISFYEEAEIFENSVNRFRTCGIWFFNYCVFTDEVATVQQEFSRQVVSSESDRAP